MRFLHANLLKFKEKQIFKGYFYISTIQSPMLCCFSLTDMQYYWLNVCWMTQNPLISIIRETIYSDCNAHGNCKMPKVEWQMVNGKW